jgi:branched-chain amino acid transport system substrate-binding protein
VYVSLPLRGASAPHGRDAADGARLALADAGGEAGGVRVEARYLDDTQGTGARAHWTPAQAAANARAATEDSTAIAYVGDFESGATRASLPITNGASLLQVSPASSAEDLVEDFPGDDELPETQPGPARTFGRVIPGDAVQARAAALWARRLVGGAAAASSDKSAFGKGMAAEFERVYGRTVQAAPDIELLFYAGASDREPRVVSPEFGGRVMVSDAGLPPTPAPTADYATSAALDPSQLPPAGRDFVGSFEAEYGRPPGRYAAYGYEAMGVVLDSIDRASDPVDRASVIDAFFDTTDRDSVLGTYSIDELGETTLGRVTGYRLDRGRAQPVAGLSGND